MGRRAGSFVAARAGWAGGRVWASRTGSEVGRARPPAVRPARYTCSGARSWSCLRSLGRGRARRLARVRGVGGTEIAQHVLEALVAQHRALEAGRADVDAQQVEQIVRADARDLREWLALDLVGQEAGAGLADGASTAGEADAIHDPVLHTEHQRDPVATQRVGAFVRGVGVLDDPEVVGPPVVLEDVRS